MLPIFFTPTPFFYPFIDFLIAFLSFSSLLLLELFFDFFLESGEVWWCSGSFGRFKCL